MQLGHCYDNALTALMENEWGEYLEVRLCHGYPKLSQGVAGHPPGTVYGHAWVEARLEQMPDVVLCFNQVPEVVLPREVYYAQGKIDPRWVTRYSYNEATEQMAKHLHCGPWNESPPGAVFGGE